MIRCIEHAFNLIVSCYIYLNIDIIYDLMTMMCHIDFFGTFLVFFKTLKKDAESQLYCQLP